MNDRDHRDDLTKRGTIEELARRYEFRPKKGLSQNFLLRRDVIDQAVAASACGQGDWILEVGAGFGVLTEALLASGATVSAFEIDHRLVGVLRERLGPQKHLTILGEDFFRWFREHGAVLAERPYGIVSNLPYHISSHFFETVLSADSPPQVVVVLLQKELAERIAAAPGQWSLLTLSVRLFGTPEILMTVPKTAFWPQPSVDSALLAVRHVHRPSEASDGIFRLARMAFSNRRKQLHNSLKAGLGWPEQEMQELFLQSGLSPAIRPQELDVAAWRRLAHVVSLYETKERTVPEG